MGGSWVSLEDSSKALDHTSLEVRGPRKFSAALPFPPIASGVPLRSNGRPEWYREVALLAIPEPKRLPGHEFVFALDPPGVHDVQRVVLSNTPSEDAARDFTVEVSATDARDDAFRQVLRASLQRSGEAQEFRFPAAGASHIRLRILNSHDPASDRVQLAEFEVYAGPARNLAASHQADRTRDGARLLRHTSALGLGAVWTADNIHDGVKSGPAGTWSSAGLPPLVIPDPAAIVDLSAKLSPAGQLEWDVPPGNWLLLRFVCLPTGERLKVPSPNSNGWATDHMNAGVTRRYMDYVLERLRKELGDFRATTLRDIYLASYEVRGGIWTPDMPRQFRQYRGYDILRYLPALTGGIVKDWPTTDRFLYDYRKTLGDLTVDAYYRAAGDAAHRAGLTIKSEAGGPGPPIHQVPVDALKALGSMDSVQGEFWPRRPDADLMWVVKETAAAAHIYGKRRVHMESFTSTAHFQDGPQDLKPSADRVFCEGANHIVWHTAAHQPPEAGRPGWYYGAGTHLSPNDPWWPMAQPFLQYLARASFLLQQGLFVADVLYYYGDQGYNFVPPKHVDPSLGYGYDYDVTNPEVIQTRLLVRNGRLTLPDGMNYELLVLPEREDMDLDVLRQVEKLVLAGATVVGPKPIRANGLTGWPGRDGEVRQLADKIWGPCDGRTVKERGYGRGRVIWGRPLREILAGRKIGPDFSFSSPLQDTQLDFIHRRSGDADIYFVRNKTPRWERVEAAFRVTGKAPELWLPDTGEIRPPQVYRAEPGVTKVPLDLEPNGSVFVVFRRGAARNPAASAPELLPGAREVSGPWQVSFPAGWGAPPSVTLPELISWTEHADQGVRYFSGVARYDRDIDIPADWLGAGRQVYLDLGRLWVAGEVSLNGKSLGVVWKEPFRLEIASAARAGVNHLTVAVANTWSNRLTGDARSTSSQRYTRTNITATDGIPWAKAPLLKSGLFGPVRLIPARAPATAP
jgi:hypothetical protein